MIESRCGILCSKCSYNDGKMCSGCMKIKAPFWAEVCPVKTCCEDRDLTFCGQCGEFPCELLHSFAYHEEQGDDGRRIEQCRIWNESL